ncbi:hypothetical protein AAG906_014456 [Vitis piasezkii]
MPFLGTTLVAKNLCDLKQVWELKLSLQWQALLLAFTTGNSTTMMPLHMVSVVILLAAALGDDEEKQQPYNGGSNWLSEYDPSIYQCWGEDFQFCGRGTDDNGYSGGLEKTEDSYHGGEEYDSYYKEVEKQPAYDNYGPWSSYGSLFGCGAEEDFYESNWQEPKLTQSFPDELGIYQGIFGYRPCFFQKDQKNYGEQEAYDHGNPWKGTADYLFGNSFRW